MEENKGPQTEEIITNKGDKKKTKEQIEGLKMAFQGLIEELCR